MSEPAIVRRTREGRAARARDWTGTRSSPTTITFAISSRRSSTVSRTTTRAFTTAAFTFATPRASEIFRRARRSRALLRPPASRLRRRRRRASSFSRRSAVTISSTRRSTRRTIGTAASRRPARRLHERTRHRAARIRTRERVDLVSARGRGRSVRVVPSRSPKAIVAAYSPEANPLVPLASFAEKSRTPTSKSIRVTLARSRVEISGDPKNEQHDDEQPRR